METEAIVTAPEKTFKRFLYTGQKSSKYVAGSNKFSNFGELTFFSDVVKDLTSACQTVKVLEEAKKNSSFSEHIVYALAATVQNLSKEDKDYETRELFYQIVPNILTNSEELMLFVKYVHELGMKKGTRLQNCIKSWYKKCSFDILSNDIALIKHRHGWTHHDIIRLTHLVPYSLEQLLLLTYLWSGIEEVSKMKDLPENVLYNMTNADSLKKCHNFNEASVLITKMNNLKISLLPMHLLRSRKDNSEVWKALVERISPSEILQNIEYLQIAGMLEDKNASDGKAEKSPRPQLTSHLISVISKITAPPILAYITYCNYKNNHSFLKTKEKVRKVKKSKETESNSQNNDTKSYISKNKKLRAACGRKCSPSHELSMSLKNLVDRSLKSVERAINITCLIALDMQDHMFYSSLQPKNNQSNEVPLECPIEETGETAQASQPKDEKNIKQKRAKCYYSKNVVPGHAGILLALYVSKLIKNTQVAVYTHDGVKILKLYKSTNKEIFTIDEAETAIKNVTRGRAAFQKPFNWAISNKVCVDLFINVVDTTAHITEYTTGKKSPDKTLYSLLKKYREAMNVPETRAITISLSSHKTATTNDLEEGILDIAGFDATVPEIIKNFALREFD